MASRQCKQNLNKVTLLWHLKPSQLSSCLIKYLGARVASNRPAKRPIHISLKQSVLLLNAKPGSKTMQHVFQLTQ